MNKHLTNIWSLKSNASTIHYLLAIDILIGKANLSKTTVIYNINRSEISGQI